MNYHARLLGFMAILLTLVIGCTSKDSGLAKHTPCEETEVLLNTEDGCDDGVYPPLETSEYVLPYPPGRAYPTGLTNCSVSYHAEGKSDEFAVDFDMPNRTEFYAIRAGVVVEKVEDRPNSNDGSSGNYVHIKHSDNTFALYYHSPPGGIYVDVGETVKQGQLLGITGTSGLAGYPHLHLTVVKDQTTYPYQGVPISFKNVIPRHSRLKSNYTSYTACDY